MCLSRCFFLVVSFFLGQSVNKMAKRFIPVLDRVLVQRIKPELRSKAGIYLPDSAKGPTNQATVREGGKEGKGKRGGEGNTEENFIRTFSFR